MLPVDFVTTATTAITSAVSDHIGVILTLVPVILLVVFGKKILGWVSKLAKFR